MMPALVAFPVDAESSGKPHLTIRAACSAGAWGCCRVSLKPYERRPHPLLSIPDSFLHAAPRTDHCGSLRNLCVATPLKQAIEEKSCSSDEEIACKRVVHEVV
jgi:hypothetical protein